MEKKASEVVQLGDECPGGHRVDPVKAAQPGRGGRIQHACVPPRSGLIRSPGLRGIRDGAMTWHGRPCSGSSRWSS